MLSIKGQDGAVDDNPARKIREASKAIGASSLKNYKLTCTIKNGLTKKKTKEHILQAIEDVTTYLNLHQFVQCCEVTGETDQVSIYIVGNVLSFLSQKAYAEKSQALDMQEQTTQQKGENVFLGIIGAFLGSLIGVAAIVIIGQLGYVSLLSGLVMGTCVIKGYELLAKRLSKKGVVVSAVIILVMTYFANQLDWTFTIARAFQAGGYSVSIFDVFPQVNQLLAENNEMSTYYTNLALIALTTLISAGITIASLMKSNKTRFEIRKLV